MVKHLGLIIGIIFGLVFGLLMGVSITQDRDEKEVDCYDRFSNKIIGEKCLQEGMEFSPAGKIVGIFVFAIVFSVIGIAIGFGLDMTMGPI